MPTVYDTGYFIEQVVNAPPHRAISMLCARTDLAHRMNDDPSTLEVLDYLMRVGYALVLRP